MPSPEALSISMAATHDFDGYAAKELEDRQLVKFPPFVRVVRVVFEHEDEGLVRKESERCVTELKGAEVDGAIILGPGPAPMAQVRGRSRFNAMIKCGTDQALSEIRTKLIELTESSGSGRGAVRFTIDVDPVSLF